MSLSERHAPAYASVLMPLGTLALLIWWMFR